MMHRLPQLGRLLVSSFNKSPFLSKNQQKSVISDTPLKFWFFSASSLDAKVGSSHSEDTEIDRIKNTDVGVGGQEPSEAESSLASESTGTKGHITHQQSHQSSSFNLEDRDMAILEDPDAYNNNKVSPRSNSNASVASAQHKKEGYQATPPPIEEDPADQFGTVRYSELGRSVLDSVKQAKFATKEELESDIFSMDTVEEEDDKTVVPLEYSDRWNMRKLKIKVKEELGKGQLPKALDMFTNAMKTGGFNYELNDLGQLYTVLIAACGTVGHVKMAFKLFNDMRKRGCKIKPGVFTSLFNSLAMSTGDRETNLERLERTRIHMAEKGYVTNLFHYHVMIKAYGRLGQLQPAFALVDEMIEQSLKPELSGLRPTTETFSFLFQACISDKENGFRHSIVTWTKMMDMGVRPNIFTFNLFLRAIRECGIVLPKPIRKELGRAAHQDVHHFAAFPPVSKDDKNLAFTAPAQKDDHETKLLPPIQSDRLENNCLGLLMGLETNSRDRDEKDTQLSGLERLISDTSSEMQIFLKNSATPTNTVQKLLMFEENRLALLGGLKTVINELERCKVRPDLKTVTELVQLIHPLDFTDLMYFVDKSSIKLDTDFFNLMIQKYIKWHQYRDAKDVLQLMHKKRAHPNVMTWGIFTQSCKSWKSGKTLLRDMDNYRMDPNIEIMGGLLASAINRCDPHFVLRVIEEVKLRDVKINRLFVERVLSFKELMRKGVVAWESGSQVQPIVLRRQLEENTDEFYEYLQKFKLRYKMWIKNIPEHIINEINNPEMVRDPWAEDYENRMKSIKARADF